MRSVVTSMMVLFLGGSLCSAQSLVEVAKREKERRMKLRGDKKVVTTRVPEAEPIRPPPPAAHPAEKDSRPPDAGQEAPAPISHESLPIGRTRSLVEVAEKESERRQELRGSEARKRLSAEEIDQIRARYRWSVDGARRKEAPQARVEVLAAVSGSPGPSKPERIPGEAESARVEDDETGERESFVPLASLSEEAHSGSSQEVTFQTSRGAQRAGKPSGQLSGGDPPVFRRPAAEELYFDGAVYLDWFRTLTEDGFSTSQLSNRLKLTAGSRPGEGWRLYVDARDRLRGGSRSAHQLILYDARLIFEDLKSPYLFSAGQMNLYETAGVGQLTGAVMGYRFNRNWNVGGYGGLEPNLYGFSYDLDYAKYGFFTQYRGSGAKSATLSYNTLRFDGQTERAFLHGSGLIPVRDSAVIYGSAEVELGDSLTTGDRLSQLFLNTRYNFTGNLDVTAFYSSGKGLDFHRFLLEQSQDPDRNSAELERFYYSLSYGARLSYKPHRRMRVFVAQRESEQKDRSIRNHTTQIGASGWDIAATGFSLYGMYNINRGDASESDSYRVSIGRDFGPLSWTAYYSTTFNGIRFDARTGRPEIIRVADRRTLSNDFFFSITHALALSLEHDLSRRGAEGESSLFFRLSYRF